MIENLVICKHMLGNRLFDVFLVTCAAWLQTLPPIRKCLLDSEHQRERGRRRFEENFRPRPTPPKPYLLHLGMTARTHKLCDFQQNFPDQVNHYFTDRYKRCCMRGLLVVQLSVCLCGNSVHIQYT